MSSERGKEAHTLQNVENILRDPVRSFSDLVAQRQKLLVRGAQLTAQLKNTTRRRRSRTEIIEEHEAVMDALDKLKRRFVRVNIIKETSGKVTPSHRHHEQIVGALLGIICRRASRGQVDLSDAEKQVLLESKQHLEQLAVDLTDDEAPGATELMGGYFLAQSLKHKPMTRDEYREIRRENYWEGWEPASVADIPIGLPSLGKRHPPHTR